MSDRDQRIEAIVQRYKNEESSYAVAEEAILFSDDEADDQRRKACGIASRRRFLGGHRVHRGRSVFYCQPCSRKRQPMSDQRIIDETQILQMHEGHAQALLNLWNDGLIDLDVSVDDEPHRIGPALTALTEILDRSIRA